ncbi:MAG: DUF3303 domain-containing protein, partial [Bryobacteraceae bacterium]
LSNHAGVARRPTYSVVKTFGYPSLILNDLAPAKASKCESRAKLRSMLAMVIEHFKNGDPKPIRERFFRDGRMMPEGVTYHASWVDPAGARCFQVMEANDLPTLQVWISRWADLIDFDVVPVMTSRDYWASIGIIG